MKPRSRRHSQECAQSSSPTIVKSLTISTFVLVPGPDGSLISIKVASGIGNPILKTGKSVQISSDDDHFAVGQVGNSVFQ